MSSGFISEAEIAEQRKVRQEEWDRVRTADAPLEAPEEAYDPRSLFDRLQEQKNKRDTDYEEAHKLKHMIKGLDDDEVEFLNLVDQTKLAEERKKNLEEEKEMRDFKAAVATLNEKSMDERLKQELKKPQSTAKSSSGGSSRNSQLKLLTGVVIKKSTAKTDKETPTPGMKRKLSDTNESEKPADGSPLPKEAAIDKSAGGEPQPQVTERTSAMKCIGILPGLGSYEDSSDSDCSSDTDQESEPKQTKYDMLGREIIRIQKKETS